MWLPLYTTDTIIILTLLIRKWSPERWSNLRGISWQIIISRNGYSNISGPMCLSRTLLFPIKKPNLFLLHLNLGWTLWLPQWIGFQRSDAMSLPKLGHEKWCNFHLPLPLSACVGLEPSHHAMRKPKQLRKRPTWRGTKNQNQFASHLSEPSWKQIYHPSSSHPS